MSVTILILTFILAIAGSYEDIGECRISNRTLYFGCGIVILKLILYREFVQVLSGATAGFIILYVMALISNGGIGGGDIKLMAIYGAIIGANNVMLAQLLGLCTALLGAMLMKKFRKSKEIQLIPFLSLGVLIVYIPIILTY